MSNDETNKFMNRIWSKAERGFLAIHSLPSNATSFYDLSVKGELGISIKDISSMNGQQNIYHTMGLLKIPPVNGRGAQANVIGIPGLWMDFDVKGGNHKNQKLPDSIDECLEFLKTLNHPPSVIVASGGGLHAYWLFDKILYFKNDEEKDKIRNLSKNFQQSIILKAAANGWEFDDTSDLARLLRIPGTFNYKNIKNPKNVKIIEINDQKYSIDQFEDLNKGKGPNSNKFDKSLILQGVPKGKRNESIFRYARSLFAKGLAKEEAWVLAKKAASACHPPQSEKEAQNCFQSASRYHSRDQFSEKSTFIPTQLTNYIREIHDLFYDGTDYLRYTEKGLWEQFQELEIKKDMIAALGKKATNAKINNAMGLLEGEVHLDRENINSDFNLLNLQNGMLNVRKRKLLPHDKKYYSTVQIPIKYDSTATCPRFIKFLGEIFQDDPSKAQTLQDFAGYILYPDIFIHACIFLIGSGANGKSVLVNTLSKLVGIENVALLDLNQLSNRFMLSTLKDKLLNTSTEVQTKSPIVESIFKQVISGDPVQADVKFKKPIKFRPFAKHIFSMNEPPILTDKTYALERRLIIVQFNQRFTEDNQDKFLENKLAEELPGILNWALEGQSRVLSNKEISISKTMEADRKEFLKKLDPVQYFIEERCVLGEGFEVARYDLYNEYFDWTKMSGVGSLGRPKFYERLEQDYPIRLNTFGRNSYRGIGLIDADKETPF